MPDCDKCGIANPEGAKFCNSCGAPLTLGPAEIPEVRKTVTVVFSDLTGSTTIGERLDPEALRAVLTRYYDEMKRVLEAHGGSVRELLGDAVMAVFGAPIAHEDDALRAVRAAAEMVDRLGPLNDELERDWGVRLTSRTGINTGEVVADAPGGGAETLVLGDSVNVAARLEQAAEPGQILLGEATYRLVRDDVEAERVEPLELKGKTERVPAWRLRSVTSIPAAPGRRLDSPLVGRERELEQLREQFERSVEERCCALVTVLGPAGVGKSRLTKEFLGLVEERATVLSGRCLPYGEGITFWPLAEVVREAAAIDESDAPDLAQAKIAELLGDEDDAGSIAQSVAGAIGVVDGAAALQEIFWATRKLLEALARERPLVCVFDDIHWAEPALLDLVEHVGGWSRDAPLLLLCPARPELLESRPGWGSSGSGSTTIVLHALDESQSRDLIGSLLGEGTLADEVAQRIGAAAEGNPLFVGELLRMLVDEGLLERRNGDWRATRDLSELAIPPTIQALLAARLDRLAAPERDVIQRASVVGKVFWWGAVAELSPEPARPQVGTHLQTLVHKELIGPDPTAFAGEDGFRFGHILIRDAAYHSIPKAVRGGLHERFGQWLEYTAGDRASEYQEIVGYHLEQAALYGLELPGNGDRAPELAARAAEPLRAAGRRALNRGDMPAAVNLLSRASRLLPADDPARLELLPELGDALHRHGQIAEAQSTLEEALERARAAGNRSAEGHALINRAEVLQAAGGSVEDAVRAAEQAAELFEEVADHRGLSEAFELLGASLFDGGRVLAGLEMRERALHHARQAGDERLEGRVLAAKSTSLFYGPSPLEAAIRDVEQILEWAREHAQPRVEAKAVASLAQCYAMRGDFEHARRLGEQSQAILLDLGLTVAAIAGPAEVSGAIEMLAGDSATAETALRKGYEAAEEMGYRADLSFFGAELAHALEAQGRYDEAEVVATTSREAAAEDDAHPQVLWRGAVAKVLARRGESEQAEQLAREAVALAAETDFVTLHADALMDLGLVLRLAGRSDDAAETLQEALRLYEAKENLVSAGRARLVLDELTQGAARP